jgi:hypothetical protein
VSVVCCQVEVSTTSWSLVQRSPTECGVSNVCDREASTMRRPWPTRGCRAIGKKKSYTGCRVWTTMTLCSLLTLWQHFIHDEYMVIPHLPGVQVYTVGQKVAGSIPDGVIGIFHLLNPSDRTMALGSTQPLTEMSTNGISWE